MSDRKAKHRKGKGKKAKRSYLANAMTENRHRLVVEAELADALGTSGRAVPRP